MISPADHLCDNLIRLFLAGFDKETGRNLSLFPIFASRKFQDCGKGLLRILAGLSQQVAYVRHFGDYHHTPHLPTMRPMIVPPTAPRIKIGAKALVMIASGKLSRMPKIRP